MHTKEEILQMFDLFRGNSVGIETWITPKTDEDIFNTLGNIDTTLLGKSQLNQLLILSHEADISDDFFKYYWMSAPKHTYNVKLIYKFEEEWLKGDCIKSLEHLKWGLYRLYVDGLLYFGNIRSCYRELRNKSYEELSLFFRKYRFNDLELEKRGPLHLLKNIDKESRFLIAEQACKSYGANQPLKQCLLESWNNYIKKNSKGKLKIKDLLSDKYFRKKYVDKIEAFRFSAIDILEQEVKSITDIESVYKPIEEKFIQARKSAQQNTRYYLSMVNDLDVYVATSMRDKNDFLKMADFCDEIFSYHKLKNLNIRYFDPTISSADCHEDKGLIECLMVKTAKVLIYCAGKEESYGKDAEAAMALSLGKPVIFYCEPKSLSFYRDVHPLSRLINFENGVAVGAIVTDKINEVKEILYRLLTNNMDYELIRVKKGFFKLKENLTGSIVRIQTDNVFLRETFWNYYCNKSA